MPQSRNKNRHENPKSHGFFSCVSTTNQATDTNKTGTNETDTDETKTTEDKKNVVDELVDYDLSVLVQIYGMIADQPGSLEQCLRTLREEHGKFCTLLDKYDRNKLSKFPAAAAKYDVIAHQLRVMENALAVLGKDIDRFSDLREKDK